MSHTDENWRNLLRALHDHPDSSQEKSWWAALALTNKLLAEAVEFMHLNASVVVKHREQLDEHGGPLTVLAQAQRLAEKRLDKHHDRLIAHRKRLDRIEMRLDATEGSEQGHAVDHDSHRRRLDELQENLSLHAGNVDANREQHDVLDAGVIKTFRQVDERLEALEQGRQTGMSAPLGDAEEEGQATETPEPIGQAWVYFADGQFWWDTLEPGGDRSAAIACYTRARKVFAPASLLPGRPVLVNLVPVEPDEG